MKLHSASRLSTAALGFLAATTASAQLYFDTNGTTAGTGQTAGTFTWDTGTNWSTALAGDVATTAWVNGSPVIFSAGSEGAVAYTISIGTGVTVQTNSITFNQNVSSTHTISGGTIAAGASPLNINASAALNTTGRSKTISSVITGTAGLSIAANGDTSDSGAGSNTVFALTGANTFTGNVTITSGIVTAASNFGDAANSLVLNGGGLVATATGTVARPISVGASGGILRAYGSATLTLSGAITGSGNLSKTDGGIVSFTGDGSAYTGTLRVRGGTGTTNLVSPNWAQANVDLTTTAGTLTIAPATAGATVTINGLTTQRDVFINNSALLDIDSGRLDIVNAGNWIQRASGTGSLTSSSGTLTVTNGAASGNLGTLDHQIRVNIVDFNGTTPLALVKNNVNDLTLNQINTYTGGTTINGGRISVAAIGALSTGNVTVSNGGQAFLTAAGTHANNFTINGLGQTEAAGILGAIRFASNTLSGSVTVASASRITAQGGTGTLTGALLGSAPLEINSSATGNNGTISLNGDNSAYTGVITLSQGTLNLPSSLGGSLVVAGGAANLTGGTIAGGVSATGGVTAVNGTVTTAISVSDAATLAGEGIAGNLTLGSSLGATLQANLATSGALTVNDFAVNGTTNVVASGVPAGPGPQTILNFATTSGTTPVPANFTLANAAAYRSAVFAVNATSVTLDVGSILSTTWTGSVNSDWNTNLDSNFTNGSPQTFSTFDNVTFDDSSAVNTVNFVGSIAPGSVTIANTTATYVFGGAGSLTGTTGVTKSGTGTATLGAANTFAGAISVTGGVLKLGSTGGFGLTSGITVASGAQVDVNGQTPGTVATGGYTYTIAGSGPDGNGAITNSGGGVASNAGVKTLILSGNASVGSPNSLARFDLGFANVAGTGSITGNGFTLTKVGANQIQLRAATTGMPIVINGGILGAENSDLAFGGATGSVTVNAGTVASFGTRTIATPVTMAAGTTLLNISGGGTAIWTGPFTLGGDITVQADANLALDGTLSGTGTVTRAGTGTGILALQNDASGFSGKFVNSVGTLRVESAAALGSGTGPDILTMASGTTLQGGTIAALASATVGGSGRNITHSGTGTVFYDAGAGLTLTVNGDIAGGVTNLSAQNGTVAFGGALTLADPALTNAILTARNGATLTFASGANASVRQISLGLNGQGTLANMNIAAGATVSTSRFVSSDGGSTASTINQTGGTFNITGNNNTNSTASSFLLGHWSGSTTYNLSGGTLNSTAAMLSLGWDAAGGVNFNQTGGTANLLGINLNNSRNNPAAYNLTGGRLNLGASGITNNAAKSFNASNATIGALASWSTAKPLTLAGTVTFNTLDALTGTTARNISLTGALTGTGSIVKEGEGNLGLATVSAYTGSYVVNGGAINPGAVGSAATLTLATGSNLSVAAGAALSFDLNGASTASGNDLLAVNGNVTFAPGSFVRPNFSGAPVSGNTYTLMTYTGTLTGSPVIDPAFASGTRVTYTVDTATAGQVKLGISGSAAALTWLGNGTDNKWDVNNSDTWNNAGSPDFFYNSDSVTFTDAGDNSSPINLVGTLAPASVTFDNSAKDYVVGGSGIISASIGLTKTGTGKVTFVNPNPYAMSGALAISGGTVQIGTGGTEGSLPGSGTVVFNTGTLIFNHSNSETLSRVLGGTGGTFVKEGAGTLTTSVGGNSADITINGGTLVARGGGFSTAFAAGKLITMNPGTTLDTAVHTMGSSVGGGGDVPRVTLNGANWFLNGEQYMRTLTLNGATTTKVGTLDGIRTLSGSVYTVQAAATSSTIGSPLNLVNALSLVVNDGAAADDLVISGLISNIGAVTKTGAGKVTITGTANTATGAFNINEGIVSVATLNDATVAGPLGQGTVSIDGGTLAYTGATTTSARVLALGVSGGTVAVTDAAANLTLTGALAANSLTKSGPGTLTLNALNTHGSTTVAAGTLVPAIPEALGSGAVSVTGGALDLNGQLLLGANPVSVGASGTLTGAGRLAVGTLDGTLTPGGAGVAGKITTTNDLTLGSTAVVNFELGGTASGDFDVLESQAQVTLGGTVNVSLINGFTPALGNSFDLIMDDTGQFGTATLGTLPALGSGLTWDTSAFNTTGVITVISSGPSLGSFNTSNFTIAEQGNAAISGPAADPDGDGVSNVLEYAFASNPKAASRANLPVSNTTVSSGSTYIGCVYTRVKGATDLAFTVQFSSTPDSSGFTDAVAGVDYTLVSTVDNGSTETITIRDNTPVSPSVKRFVRILVTYP